MHTLLIGEFLTERKAFDLYLLKQGRSHQLIHVKDLFTVD